jgi:uncharacterized protein
MVTMGRKQTLGETTMRAVTIITQTRVREGCAETFAKFVATVNDVVSAQPGFIEQSVLPPSSPGQVDWVVLQRFMSDKAATAWLHSERRHALLAEMQSLLSGHDDVHLVRDSAAGALPSPHSAVISTRVKPGRELEYRSWERRIAASLAGFPGFQGYRFEPPIPDVQDKYVAILRFASEATLQDCMRSSELKRLLADAEGLTERVSARIVSSGFSQWFPTDVQRAPIWKGNMLVLVMLYPTVFLFNLFVGQPLLSHVLHLPFWLLLFCANFTGVWILTVIVPRLSERFSWWLKPALPDWRVDLGGACLIIFLYFVLFGIFSRL